MASTSAPASNGNHLHISHSWHHSYHWRGCMFSCFQRVSVCCCLSSSNLGLSNTSHWPQCTVVEEHVLFYQFHCQIAEVLTSASLSAATAAGVTTQFLPCSNKLLLVYILTWWGFRHHLYTFLWLSLLNAGVKEDENVMVVWRTWTRSSVLCLVSSCH